MKRARLLSLLVLLLAILVPVPAAGQTDPGLPPSPAAPGNALLAADLANETNGHVKMARQPGTAQASFIGTDAGHPIPPPATLPAHATPEQAARGFLNKYGALFGLHDQSQELKAARVQEAPGRSYVRFQQVAQGVPIMGAELVVQNDAGGNTISANGKTLPDAQFDASPGIDARAAQSAALGAIAAEYKVDAGRLSTSEPTLWVYNPRILGAPGLQIDRLVWRMDVTLGEPPISELVLVDAHTGNLALHFSQIDTAKDRRIYDNQNVRNDYLPGNGPVRTEGQGPSASTDANDAYDNAGIFYDFYMNVHARDGIDGAGMPLVSTVRYCPTDPLQGCPWGNAAWTGSQMVYGAGWPKALDIVAHEMTHGVTQHESNLFYYYQSGAINESLSDIWGEIIEHNAYPGTDSAWLVGEALGAPLRSLSNPPNYLQPDKMTGVQYECRNSDSGGVHTNSGVGNKAAYLMMAGGSFNGRTISSIGITKAAKIYYELQTHLLTSAGDYAALYNLLPQACANLQGTNGITASDCQQVTNAVAAVEMDQQPATCPAVEAPLCPAGQVPQDVFFDDLENPASGNWTTGSQQGASRFYYPQNPNQPYNVDATYATSGNRNIWGADQSAAGDFYIASKSITVPATQPLYLRFNHAYSFRQLGSAYNDGGIFEFSIADGPWLDTSVFESDNGYNATLDNASPLAGRLAFGGQSFGYRSARYDISALAGSRVRFRFRMGTSSSGSDFTPQGWYIDDFRIYACLAQPAQHKLYVPLIARNPSYVPPKPVLGRIGNPGPGESYSVSWSASPQATAYTLVEDTVPDFAHPTTVFRGAATSWQARSNKPEGVYYYRVRASNNIGDSGWSSTSSVSVPASGGGFSSLFSDGFEGAFPGPWYVFDNDGATNGEYYWRKSICNAASGGYSAWAVGGGAQGYGLGCGADYPNNADSWMIYGPFSTMDQAAGQVNFRMWLDSESSFDTLEVHASTDNNYFSGTAFSGSTGGWSDRTLDLSNVNGTSLLGQPNVWIAFIFRSDGEIARPAGAYVDDVQVRVCSVGCSAISPAVGANAGATVNESPAHAVRPKR